MKTKCMIIDDEPLAIDALSLLIEKFSNLEVVATSNDAFSAFEILQKGNIDLLFLDINMPEMSGIGFLKSLTNPPAVIFTTAYREFAADAFELNVIDYLLKPVSQQRLMQAVQKYYKHSTPGEKPVSSVEGGEGDSMYVKADRKMVQIFFKDILYIKGLKDYIHIITLGKNIITRTTMHEIESKLPFGKFTRIHRSYIVANDKITAFTQQEVEIGDDEIPIGPNYRDEVMKVLSE